MKKQMILGVIIMVSILSLYVINNKENENDNLINSIKLKNITINEKEKEIKKINEQIINLNSQLYLLNKDKTLNEDITNKKSNCEVVYEFVAIKKIDEITDETGENNYLFVKEFQGIVATIKVPKEKFSYINEGEKFYFKFSGLGINNYNINQVLNEFELKDISKTKEDYLIGKIYCD